MKKYIITIIFFIFIILFFSFRALYCWFFGWSELKLKNNDNILYPYISKYYSEPEKITRIEARVIKGESEIKLYSNFKLVEDRVVDDDNEIFVYVDDNGKPLEYRYYKLILISIIILIIILMHYKRVSIKNKILDK